MRRLAIALVIPVVFGCKSKAAPAPPTAAAPAVQPLGADAATQETDGGRFGLSAAEIDSVLDGANEKVSEAIDAAAAAAAWARIAPYSPGSVASLNEVPSASPTGHAERVGGQIRLAVEVGDEKVAFATFDRSGECSDGFLEVPENPSKMTLKHEPVWWLFRGPEPAHTVALSFGTRKIGAWHWNAERACVAQTDITAMLLGPEADAIDERPRFWPIETLPEPTAIQEWSWKSGEPAVTESFEVEGVRHQLVLSAERWAVLNADNQPVAEFGPKLKKPACLQAGAERRTHGDRVLLLLHGLAGEDDCTGEENDLHEFGALAEWKAGEFLVRSSGQRVTNEYTSEGRLVGDWTLRNELQRWSFERVTTGVDDQREAVIEGDDEHCLNIDDRNWSTRWTVGLDDDALFSSTAHENLSTRYVDDCP